MYVGMKIWCLDFTGRGCKDAEECSTSSGRPGSTECVAAALESIYPGTDTVRKSAYLEAMKALHAEEILSQLKDRLAELEGEPVTEENRKHREAELRALRAILIQYEGIDTHHLI